MATIQNTTPRRDLNGNVIDCHDGCLEKIGDRYFLYGTRYGDTDGFTPANEYVCYSSPDLENWTYHGPLFTQKLGGVGYRPYVKQRPDGKIVLWFNWYATLWEGQYGVAIADKPEGPFTIVEPDAKVNGERPGDHSLFVDDDGTAYLIFTVIGEDHRVHIEKLTSDWTGSTGEMSERFKPHQEATAMFKRNGVYYATFGNTCCFCPQGAGVEVYRSESPLGPYEFVADINRDDEGNVIIPGQQTHMAQVGEQWMWLSDLWESRPDGIKGHDLQYWGPLEFDANGVLQRLRRVDEWNIDP
ncbi:MAG: family 43 glycosylhydrolase [Planctomycetota bacterium]